MAAQLSRQQADWLVSLPKRIDEQVRWKATPDNPERHSFSARIACPDVDQPMHLVGTIGRRNWSFILMTHERIPIRKLTVHGPGHTNPDGTDAGTHHKHIWDEVHRDQETYYPYDIDFSDVNAALIGFLAECNTTVSDPPEQLVVERRLR